MITLTFPIAQTNAKALGFTIIERPTVRGGHPIYQAFPRAAFPPEQERQSYFTGDLSDLMAFVRWSYAINH